MRQSTQIGLLLLLLLAVGPLSAQNDLVADTLSTRFTLLTQLLQAGNYEQAQIEAEGYRDFLRRNRLAISPTALVLISNVYKANSDERSATRLLADAELDARKDPNYETKVALLDKLVAEYRRWDLPDQALTCHKLLTIAQDTIAARQRRAEHNNIKVKLDSISRVREQEMLEYNDYFHIERSKGMLWAGIVALMFIALLVAYYLNTDRWRKHLERKELEWDMMRTNLRREAEEQAIAQAVEAAQTAVAVPPPPDPYQLYQGSKPEQVALLIEPNRQVVLYMKSLLSDRFQIETAASPNEGLQMANDLLPDLIVCDAVLNGRTGIEIARQIKLSERTNHIPVVLLTDKFGNEGKLDALRAGADVWFTRPVIDNEFDASVQRLLDARKLKHEQFNRFMQLYFTENRIPIEDPFLLRSVQMIEQNLAAPDFMADDIARKLQMTKAHFAKKLKVLTGKEPVQFIREMRLEKAKVLLEKRAGNPQAIAELVGFTSPGTFALAFKEYFGENTLLLYVPPPQNRLY
ncbi:MAG: response regulator transcription factor [Saprospiraceae bacterium]|nr:response regulator transcription factor [Saprospiraceae bacterium]